jgi:beta-galactosidase
VLEDGQLLFADGFPSGSQLNEVRFPAGSGRYFAMQSLSSHDGGPLASIAEIDLLDENGKLLPRNGWQVIYTDSEELQDVDGAAGNVLSGIPTTYWQKQYHSARPNHPHLIMLDLASQVKVSGVRCLPRGDSTAGRIKSFRLYLSASQFSGM